MEKVFDANIGEYVYRASKPSWIVKDVVPCDDFTMVITFIDGIKKIYDAKPLLEKNIYKPLQSLPFFMTARVMGDTVAWNDDIDIAPEFLYENSVLV